MDSKEIEQRLRQLREIGLDLEPDAAFVREKHGQPKPPAGVRVIYGSMIQDLLEVAKGHVRLPESFEQFVALWGAFNCWLRGQPKSSSRDKDLVAKFAAEPVPKERFRELARGNSQYKQALKKLKNLSPVYEVRGMAFTNKSVKIDDEENLAQVMDVVYLIRCNLFHGAKSLYDQRDLDLVTAAHNVLLPLFTRILLDSTTTYFSRGGQ